eukprot:1256097-Pleurochrysis_carterae.AAC.2
MPRRFEIRTGLDSAFLEGQNGACSPVPPPWQLLEEFWTASSELLIIIHQHSRLRVRRISSLYDASYASYIVQASDALKERRSWASTPLSAALASIARDSMRPVLRGKKRKLGEKVCIVLARIRSNSGKAVAYAA